MFPSYSSLLSSLLFEFSFFYYSFSLNLFGFFLLRFGFRRTGGKSGLILTIDFLFEPLLFFFGFFFKSNDSSSEGS